MKTQSIHPDIRNRWSPRGFIPYTISEPEIYTLIEAASWAASSRNSQPWRFIIALPGTEKWKLLHSCLVDGNLEWTTTASALLLTLVQKEDTKSNAPFTHRWHDLGLAIGNLTHQATHMGLHIRNMSGFYPEKAILNFDIPANFEPVTVIAVGKIDKSTQPPDNRIRRSLDQLIFDCSWDKLN